MNYSRSARYADNGSKDCLAIHGHGHYDEMILVDRGFLRISVKVRWDRQHGDHAKPQVMLLKNPAIGVHKDQTLAATSDGPPKGSLTPNEYETIRFAPVRTTDLGPLEIRLISRSANVDGTAYFSDVEVA